MAIAGVSFGFAFYMILLINGHHYLGRTASTRHPHVAAVILCHALRFSYGRLCVSPEYPKHAHGDSRWWRETWSTSLCCNDVRTNWPPYSSWSSFTNLLKASHHLHSVLMSPTWQVSQWMLSSVLRSYLRTSHVNSKRNSRASRRNRRLRDCLGCPGRLCLSLWVGNWQRHDTCWSIQTTGTAQEFERHCSEVHKNLIKILTPRILFLRNAFIPANRFP